MFNNCFCFLFFDYSSVYRDLKKNVPPHYGLLMHHFHTSHFTQASPHKNKNTKVLARATVAEKTFNREKP